MSFPRTPGRILRWACAAGLVAGFLGSCGEPPRPAAPSSTLELLRRAPDVHTEGARFDLRDLELSLEPGAGAHYRIELLAPSWLEIQGAAGSPGTLSIETSLVDSLTGEVAAPEDTLAIDAEDAVQRVVPLSHPVGSLVEVALRWSVAGDGGGTFAFEALRLREEDGPERPSILFLSIDTFSSRNLAAYGYPRETAPNLSAFAEEAVLFENFRANAPRTLHSYISQFSGFYPSASRIIDPENRWKWRPALKEFQLAEGRWTLAEMLRAAGYRTAAWVDNPNLVSGVGLSQGFDLYDTTAADISHYDLHNRNFDGGAVTVFERASEWLEDRPPDDPFFAVLQAIDVHGPYVVQDRWKGTFGDDDLYDPDHRAPIGGTLPDQFGVIPKYIWAGLDQGSAPPPEDAATAPFANAYDDAILQLDHYIGELFETLEELGLYDRLVIIVSADHGETLLGHEFYFGHGTLYDDCLRVPLLVRLPGGKSGGLRVSEPAQLVDLYPTIADLLGLDLEERNRLHGRSLLPALRGEALELRTIFAEGGVTRGFSVEYDGWKLIRTHPKRGAYGPKVTHPLARDWFREQAPEYADPKIDDKKLKKLFWRNKGLAFELNEMLSGPIYELYDLRNDPGETRNLIETEKERAEELRKRMLRELQRTKIAHALVESEGKAVKLDDRALEELRNLGYVGDEDEEEE